MRSVPARRARTAVVTTIAAALTLTGCGSSVTEPASAPADDTEATTIQNCGRDVAITGTPDAVVGLSPSQTELLLRLGLADSMVGQAQVGTKALPDDVAELAAGVPVLGDVAPPSREELLGAEPDFVFSPTTYEFTAEQGFASIEQLDQAGVAAYVATGGCFERRMEGTVDDLFVDLRNLGEIFGVPDEAEALVEQAEGELEEVADAIDGRRPPRVAQVYVEGSTLTAIGAGVEHDMMRLAGADNVFGPDDPAFADFFAAQISPEALAVEAPDAVVFAATDDAHEQATRDYLTATFPDLPAVRENRLIAISSADTFPGTLGNVSVVRQVAEQLYPDAFGG